jgi:hypothetical protein
VRRDDAGFFVNSSTPETGDPQRTRVEGFAAAAKENGAAPLRGSSAAPGPHRAARPEEPSRPQYKPRGGSRKRPDRISYAALGNSLVLTGATFGVKDELAAMGGRRAKNGEGWVWHVSSGQFDALAGLCARNSIRLVAASEDKAA